MSNLPSFQTYGQYSSKNSLQFFCGDLTVWFSYQTPVAFSKHGKRVVRENEWGPTTGKHLNAIDGGNGAKKDRVDGETFTRLLAEATA